MKIWCINLFFLNFILNVYVQSEYIHSPGVNMYYKFFNTPQTWFEARNTCKRDNATLAIPKNLDEALALVELFAKYPKSTFPNVKWNHIFLTGFHDIFQENEFITLFGESIEYYYHRWYPTEPNLGTFENCGSLDNQLKLHDYPCAEVGVYFCQRNEANTNIYRKYNKASIDIDYECSDTNCYKLHKSPQTWAHARVICQAEGGHLAIVRNKQQEDELVKIFSKIDPYDINNVLHKDNALIGVHDLYKKNHFVTVLDEDLSEIGYANWAQLKPSGGIHQNCVSIQKNGQLSQYYCNVTAMFFCEKPTTTTYSCNDNNDTIFKNGYTYNKTLNALYKYHVEKKNYADASATCEAEGSLLAIPTSMEEIAYMMTFQKDIWIGINDIEQEGKFVAVDKKYNSAILINWDPNEPNGGNRENCVYMYRPPYGTYNDDKCDVKRDFLCKKFIKNDEPEKMITTRVRETKIPLFRNDYLFNEEFNTFYKLHDEDVTYEEAMTTCQMEGTILAIPTSQQEITFMVGFSKDIWIGINDITDEGKYVAIDERYNSKIVLNWDTSEPNGTGDEDCVYMYKNGTYNDINCDRKKSFVCKKVVEDCEASITTHNGIRACKGQLIFEENFDKNILSKEKWGIEHRLPNEEQECGFLSYQQSSVSVDEGKLKITPSLLHNSLGFNKYMIIKGTLDLSSGCTAKLQSYCKIQADSYNILPPVITGRITTKDTFRFKYGRIVIRAKLPQGDWIYPELYLEPADYAYGARGYESGLMRIAFARGNLVLTQGNTEYGNNVLSGGVVFDQFEPCRSREMKTSLNKSIPWGNDFHEYGLTWNEDSIILDVDNVAYGTIESPFDGFKSFESDCKSIAAVSKRWAAGTDLAPFDREFSITIGLGAGGISDFPNNDSKPWKNTSPKAKKSFWSDSRNWHNTWESERKRLIVDSIKVWAI